jgi:biotin transport system substrate-specific component
MSDVQASPTLLQAAQARPGAESTRARALWIGAALVIGVVLLTVSAKVQVPFWPVPMTMQTFVVLMIGMAYGPKLGTGTVLAYLMVGAAGLPVFAGTPERGVGLVYMVGPTGGFLAGFLPAAWVVGRLAERGWDRTVLGCAAAATAGHLVILLAGVTWLAASLGAIRAVEVGLLPFLASTVVKTALAAVAMPLFWRCVRSRGETLR